MNTICNSTLCATVLLLLAGGASAAPDAFGQSSGLIALNSLPNPPATLATAMVVDARGIHVGAVQKVVMDENGAPLSVAVALMGSTAVVMVGADKFNYDQGHNVLTSSLEAEQITLQPRSPG